MSYKGGGSSIPNPGFSGSFNGDIIQMEALLVEKFAILIQILVWLLVLMVQQIMEGLEDWALLFVGKFIYNQIIEYLL